MNARPFPWSGRAFSSASASTVAQRLLLSGGPTAEDITERRLAAIMLDGDVRAFASLVCMRANPHSCVSLRQPGFTVDSVAARVGRRVARRARSLIVATGMASAAPAGGAQSPPHGLTTLPPDDPAYAQLAALDRGGCRPARVSPHRPFYVRDVQRAVARFAGNAACSGPVARALAARFTRRPPPDVSHDVATDLAAAVRESAKDTLETFRIGGEGTVRGTALARGEFEPLWAGVRPREEGTPPVVLDARVRAGWSASDKLAIVGEIYGQSSRRNDPTVRQRAFRNTSGIVDVGEAYLNAALGRLDVSFGRSWAAWLGDDRESMALSANGPLMDRLELGLRWRVAEVRAIIASVNDVTMTAELDSLEPGAPDTRYNRWLYGHVLTVKPNDGLELSLGETILSSRTTGGFDLAYANPVMPYVIAQNDTARVGSDTRDNLVVFGAARARIGRGHIGAEMVVDDIQIDSQDRENTADQLAWRIYASAPLPIGTSTSLRAEFTRVDSYTYMRDFYTDVYQQYDKPLGSVLGPGSDQLRLAAETWLGGGLRIAGSLGTWRQGGLRIDQRPANGPNGNAGKPFPAVTPSRPEVQTALLGDFGADYLTHPILGSVRLQLAQIRNAANVPDAAALYVRAIVSASYAFRYP